MPTRREDSAAHERKLSSDRASPTSPNFHVAWRMRKQTPRAAAQWSVCMNNGSVFVSKIQQMCPSLSIREIVAQGVNMSKTGDEEFCITYTDRTVSQMQVEGQRDLRWNVTFLYCLSRCTAKNTYLFSTRLLFCSLIMSNAF